MSYPVQPPAGMDPSVIALTSATHSVTSTASKILTIHPDAGPAVITNGSGAAVFLGRDANVTTSNGYQLAINASVLVTDDEGSAFTGGESNDVYGIVASTGSTVTYLLPTSWPVAP